MMISPFLRNGDGSEMLASGSTVGDGKYEDLGGVGRESRTERLVDFMMGYFV